MFQFIRKYYGFLSGMDAVGKSCQMVHSGYCLIDDQVCYVMADVNPAMFNRLVKLLILTFSYLKF